MGTQGQPRWHALDSLRGSMMALGLVLHGACSYRSGVPPHWPYDDPQGSFICDLLVITIHTFRMPAFFLMAGFFAALLVDRRGIRGLSSNRSWRVFLPFVVFWPLVIPLTIMGGAFATARIGAGASEAGADAWRLLSSGAAFPATTGHLWFLYDLMIFYGIAAGMHALARRWPVGPARARAIFRRAIESRFRVLWLAILTAITMIPMQSGLLDTDASFLPMPRVLVAYGLIFAWGWLLYGERDLLPRFTERVWLHLVLGGAAFVAWVVVRKLGGTVALAAIPLAALTTWAWVFGIMGLFLRYLSEPSPQARYLSDSSYWLYLAHLPLILWLAGALAPWSAPALVKLMVVLGLATPILLLSYHFVVRSTWVGVLLNGRRY